MVKEINESKDALVSGFVFGMLQQAGLNPTPQITSDGDYSATIRIPLPANPFFSQTYVDLDVTVPDGPVDADGAEALARAAGWKPGDRIAD